MVLTNALLSIAFGIVANFTNVVPIPDEAVPKRVEDLARFIVGSPSSPLDMFLVDRKGTEFEISGGVVRHFDSPGSYFGLQDPRSIDRYRGSSQLSSNEVVEIARKTLQRLVRNGDPLRKGPPFVLYAGISNGQRIPFCKVSWGGPVTSPDSVGEVEIDERDGRIVFLHLWHPAFLDYEFALEISNRVFRVDPVVKRATEESRVPKYQRPHPSPEFAGLVIRDWLRFCGKIGISPGGQTNLSDINWDRTWLYTNGLLSATNAVCQVRFKNGTCFESFRGTTIGHFSREAFFTGYWDTNHEGMIRLRGPIFKHWEELAANLEKLLVNKLAIPTNLISGFKPSPEVKPPEFQSVEFKRSEIGWRHWPPHPGRSISVRESTLGFVAEFDLETGQLELIYFREPRFVDALVRSRLSSTP